MDLYQFMDEDSCEDIEYDCSDAESDNLDGFDDEGNDLSDLEEDTYLATLANSETRTEKRGRPKGYKNTDFEQTASKRVKRELISIESLVAYLCCLSVCLAELPCTALKKARDTFQNLTTLQRSQFILDWLSTHTRRPDNITVFLIEGKQVCQNAWLACLGIPKSTFYATWTKFLDGVKVITGPGNTKGKVTADSQYALSWLQSLAARYADKMPDSNKLHLPCCLRKKDVYNMMTVEAEVYEQHVVSMTHFLRLWRRFFPHIIIPKRSRFSKCDACSKLKTEIEKTMNRETKKKLFKLREMHLEQQNQERRKYYKHAQKARQTPNRYLSIILDGMDQDKTSLPHTRSNPKGLSNLWRVKINLMGAIVHGYGTYGFFDTFQWAHGSSFTISVLVHTLLMMTHIPPILYLQLDNCPGQNKNRYMLGFLALLIEWDILEKVKLSFLMVGHTHEDIDQLFSRFSVWLGNRDIFTFDNLVTGFEQCYKPKPTGIKLHEVYNFGEYLPLNDISNHSKPHVFKIVKENGKAVIYTKKWSTDKSWNKCTGDYLLKECPNDPVKLICPTIDKIDEKVINDIQTFATFYKDENMDREWTRYFAELKEQEDSWQDSQENIYQKLKNNRQEMQENSEFNVETLAAELDIQMINAPIPPVIIGKKTRKATLSPSSSIEPGSFVLVDLAKYADEWPQVAKVVSVPSSTEVQVHWFKGAKTTTWSPGTRRQKGSRGGKTEPLIETIYKTVIWLSGFSLTPSGHLPKHVRHEIDVYFD